MTKHQNKKIGLTLLIFLPIVLLYSCNNCSYVITNEYIECSCGFEQGFSFQELDVDSIDSQGKPISRKVIKWAELFLNSPCKRVYFYKQNNDYEWFYNNKMFDTLPIVMKEGHWYYIRALVVNGHPFRAYYIFINPDGSMKTILHDEQTNF